MVSRARNGNDPPGRSRPGPAAGVAGRHKGLELDEDLPFQYVVWRFQRIGWAAIAAILLAALLGLFGSGPLSRSTASDPSSPVWVEYERFGRRKRPTTLHVHLGPGSWSGGQARVWVDRAYLDDLDVQDIIPQPEREELGPGRAYFLFAATHPDRPGTVTLHVQPDRFGVLAGAIGVGDEPPIRFRQWIYP